MNGRATKSRISAASTRLLPHRGRTSPSYTLQATRHLTTSIGWALIMSYKLKFQRYTSAHWTDLNPNLMSHSGWITSSATVQHASTQPWKNPCSVIETMTYFHTIISSVIISVHKMCWSWVWAPTISPSNLSLARFGICFSSRGRRLYLRSREEPLGR